MSPNRVTKSTSPKKPASSVNQLLFFETIFANMNGKLDVDWAAVATKAGYGSGAIARIRFNQIINRLKSINNDGTPKSSPAEAQSPRLQTCTPQGTGMPPDGTPTTPSKPTRPKLVQRKKAGDTEAKKGRSQVVAKKGDLIKSEALFKGERVFHDTVQKEFKTEVS